MRKRVPLSVLAGGALLLSLVCAACTRGQDSGDQGTLTRGSRAEISVTVRDRPGGVVTAPATVKLLQDGMPLDQSATSHGRAFFVPRTLGDFTIVVEATGYKSAQKEISLRIPEQAEVDIYLERNLEPNETAIVPGRALLAPKAQEALSKGTQALREGKLKDAEKHLNEAVKLAPGNPEVLYVQGMLYMKEQNWAAAQTVFGKSDQLEPNQPRVLAALGMVLCDEGKYEQAIPMLEKSLQLQTNPQWETAFALAKAYYYRERYEPALKLAEQAHEESHAVVAQVELLLAQCLTAAGRYEDSAQVLRQFLKTGAASPEAATARRWLDGLAANGKIQR